VPLFAINGPDVVSQFYGESEEALRAVFTAAEEAAPSVVLSNSFYFTIISFLQCPSELLSVETFIVLAFLAIANAILTWV